MRIRLLACFIAVTGVCFAQNIIAQDSVQTADTNFEKVTKPVILSKKNILTDMKAYNPEMYSQYRSGKKTQITGIAMIGAGVGFILTGAIFSNIPDTEKGNVTVSIFGIDVNGDHSGLRKARPVLMVAGVAGLSAGFPVMITGKKKKKQTLQDFKNQYYLSQPPSSYFQMNIYPNGAGIAYVF